ncbi:SMI1/KNR4 family protein [Deinococcus arcticus]|uniref:Smi n=1 Tax=Deinococcus arcticus TaxID=2136176 RepID=A0A2T3W7R3_9DEIO|nr:SMI1/KNR4 family protein [Deinococcus arcticus]PTA67950.1 Smi [Deinococcus arcticus]
MPNPTPFHTIRSWWPAEQTAPTEPENLTPLFQRLERELKVAVPDDLQQYFHQLNPLLARQAQALFYGLSALPLQAGLDERGGFLSSVFMDPAFQTVEAVDPPGTVRPVAFDAGWLPLAHDHSGAYIAADLRPDPGGQVGQIINFGARELKRFVLASSITQFLSDLLQNIAQGRVEQVCEAGVVEVRFTDADITHPLDLCEQFGAQALRPAGSARKQSPGAGPA